MRKFFGFCLIVIVACSCASKKEILYIQDAQEYGVIPIEFSSPKIQPNDILKIDVGALVQESVLPYINPNSNRNAAGVEVMLLNGYLVTKDNTINFPQLGVISTENKTILELQDHIKKLLEDGGHLKNPTVNVRLLNAKVTILGEVNSPGTYSFTEYNITLLQALGYASDLTINGKREDVIIVRESEGNRLISHIDLTSTDFIGTDFYQIRPNDVIIVNPNNPKVKSAGFVGNLGAFLSVFSILLTTIVLISR